MTTAEKRTAAVAREPRRWQFSLAGLLVWIAIAGVLLAMGRLGWLAIGNAGEAARHSSCQGHCCQLAVALHNYHDHYGSFPPAYIADASGKPMHSWRVLLLPFIEKQALYQRYNFNEPWNGPNNRMLAAQMPETYGCPSARGRPVDETNYVVVVGPGTAWPGATTVSLSQVTDNEDQTLLFVEIRDSGISWMEPRDLDINTMPRGINARGRLGISSFHPAGANAGLVSGRTDVLDRSMSQKALRSRLTIAAAD
jgi:hypothetical protein